MNIRIEKLTSLPVTPVANSLLFVKNPAKAYVDVHSVSSDATATHPLITQEVMDTRIEELSTSSALFKKSINSVVDQYVVNQVIFDTTQGGASVIMFSHIVEEMASVDHILVRTIYGNLPFTARLFVGGDNLGNETAGGIDRYTFTQNAGAFTTYNKDILTVDMPAMGISEIIYNVNTDFEPLALKARAAIFLEITELVIGMSDPSPVIQVVFYGIRVKGEQFPPTSILKPMAFYLNYSTPDANNNTRTITEPNTIFATDKISLWKGAISLDVNGAIFQTGKIYGTFSITSTPVGSTVGVSYTVDAIAVSSQTLANVADTLPATFFPIVQTYDVYVQYNGYTGAEGESSISATNNTDPLYKTIVDNSGNATTNPFPMAAGVYKLTIDVNPNVGGTMTSILPGRMDIPILLSEHTAFDSPTAVLKIGDTYATAQITVYTPGWSVVYNDALPLVATGDLTVSVDLTPAALTKYDHLAFRVTYIQGDLTSSEVWQSIAYGNGVYVMLAYGYGVVNVVNEFGCTAQSLPPGTYNWTCLTFGNGVFVAVAHGSTVSATSPDGINWTQQTLPSSVYWQDVIFGNGVFLAIAFSSNVCATSPDGITWTQHTMPSSSTWYAVAYGNGIFVAVASEVGLSATSTDGITWTQHATTGYYGINSITYGNGVFVAMVYSSTIAITSPDGVTWTQRTLPIYGYWHAITFADGIFVAATLDLFGKYGTVVAVSVDGAAWTMQVLPTTLNQTADTIAYCNGKFVIPVANTSTYLVLTIDNTPVDLLEYNSYYVGYSFNDTETPGFLFHGWSDGVGGPIMTKSPITLTITPTTPLVQLMGDTYNYTATATIDIDNGDFPLSIGGSYDSIELEYLTNSSMSLLTMSLDGINWILHHNALPILFNITAAGNGLIVGLENSSDSYVSSDAGKTWVMGKLPTSGNWYGLVYGNGLFVAFNDGDSISATSTDGLTWVQHISPALDSLYCTAFGNGLFVTCGYGTSDVYTSTDGVVWNKGTLPVSASWNSAAFGNGVFVVANEDSSTDIILTSTDGLTWTQRTTSFQDDWYVATYGNGVFFIGNYQGTNSITSPDGITWTEHNTTSFGFTSFYSAMFDNGVFIMLVDAVTTFIASQSVGGNASTATEVNSDNNYVTMPPTTEGVIQLGARWLALENDYGLLRIPTTPWVYYDVNIVAPVQLGLYVGSEGGIEATIMNAAYMGIVVSEYTFDISAATSGAVVRITLKEINSVNYLVDELCTWGSGAYDYNAAFTSTFNDWHTVSVGKYVCSVESQGYTQLSGFGAELVGTKAATREVNVFTYALDLVTNVSNAKPANHITYDAATGLITVNMNFVFTGPRDGLLDIIAAGGSYSNFSVQLAFISPANDVNWISVTNLVVYDGYATITGDSTVATLPVNINDHIVSTTNLGGSNALSADTIPATPFQMTRGASVDITVAELTAIWG